MYRGVSCFSPIDPGPQKGKSDTEPFLLLAPQKWALSGWCHHFSAAGKLYCSCLPRVSGKWVAQLAGVFWLDTTIWHPVVSMTDWSAVDSYLSTYSQADLGSIPQSYWRKGHSNSTDHYSQPRITVSKPWKSHETWESRGGSGCKHHW